MNRRFRFYRKIAAWILAFFIIVLPFIKVDGHSALRFDVPGQKLYFFGTTLWMDEFFVFLIVVLVFSLFFLWITIVFGRLWCGWACPQVILTDLTGFFLGKKSSPLIRKASGHFLAALLCIFVAANLIWYFLSPYDFFYDLINLDLSGFVYQLWMGTAFLIWADIVLLGKVFCAKICPYARFQSVLYDQNTMTIAYIEERADECIECKKCIKDCPVDIDIRDGQHFSCVACAQCIDACDTIFRKKNLGPKSLIHYTYGESNHRKLFSGWARNSTLGLTVVLTGLLILLLVNQTEIEIDIIKNSRFKTRLNKEGLHLNAFQLSAVNKTGQAIKLRISAFISDHPAGVKPEQFILQAGDNLRKRIIVRAAAPEKKPDTEKIVFLINIVGDGERQIFRESLFRYGE